MQINRRHFLGLFAGGVAATILSPAAKAASEPKYKAIAFDAFPVFDPRPVGAMAEKMFPGKGTELITLWRNRQFEYTWLRSMAQRYADFMTVTSDALTYATRAMKLDMTRADHDALANMYTALKPWPDVLPALNELKTAGIRLAFLSNFTEKMLDGCIKTSGLDGMFSDVISTDRAKTYKPAPKAYQLGVDVLGYKRDEILFAAFAGWDAAGAQLFGYPTFWVNRLGAPAEELDVLPIATGKDLSELTAFALKK